MPEKIVFFGGTFDPPHTEHVNIAAAAAKRYRPDRLIVMPTAIPPHKSSIFAAEGADRLKMCEIAFSGIENVEVSDFEIKNGGKSYSYITLKKLREDNPDADIVFAMGTDMLRTFSEWKNPNEILENCRIALIQRSGDESAEKTLFDFERQFGKKADVIDYVGQDVSSTECKISLMLALSPENIPDGVLSYIRENSLYKPDEYFGFVVKNLPEKRRIHTKGVILEAINLAKNLKVDISKAVTAACLHDAAKYLDYRNYKDFSMPDGVPESVVHQYLGGYIAENVLGVTDGDIIEAITYHTTAKAGMCLLAKIIYVADMIERGRNFQGVETLRAKVYENFDEGFKACLEFTKP